MKERTYQEFRPTMEICSSCGTGYVGIEFSEKGDCFKCAYFRLQAENERLRSAEFWSNWIYPDGANPQDIQNELKDYYELMERVSRVYVHVTGGIISKPETTAEGVMEAFNDYLEDCIRTALEEAQDE